MVTHLMRDFNTTTSSTIGVTGYSSAYLLILFLRRVLNYTVVGQTNYNINSIGTLLIATGDSTPTGTATWNPADRASISKPSSVEVAIPVSIRTVSAADNNRILVLKSTANPNFNSGAFRITSFNSGSNSYIIDYRSNDTPPVESGTLEWYLYENDTSAPQSGPSNPGTGYRSRGSSTAPRIILQSPESIGWQVRICNESSTDWSTNSSLIQTTVAPGFDGDAAGDFAVGGRHLHGVLFYDTSSNIYKGLSVGFGHNSSGTSHLYRLTMIGDGYGVTMIGRRQNDTNNPLSFMSCFGVAENPPSPLPGDNVERLYSLGSAHPFNGGNNLGNIAFTVPAIQSTGSAPPGIHGVSHDTGRPVFALPSLFTYLSGQATNDNTGPQTSSNAGDCPFLGATEVMPVDLVSGCFRFIDFNTSGVFAAPHAPRFMGNVRHVRQGRTNFTNFTLTTDASKSWQHMRNGVYLPWNGPALVP